VDYRTAPAEASGLEPASLDLVTVAQAAHWFDLPAFYAEVRRVLKPGGVLALWCYERLTLNPELDAPIAAFYAGLLGPYWPPERQWVEAGYRTLEFPLAEIASPAFDMTADWNLEQLLGYFSTWSALKRYRQATGQDPLPALGRELAALWGGPERPKPIKWPLSARVGRIPA
jgi:SAM-dependent methyltransferase